MSHPLPYKQKKNNTKSRKYENTKKDINQDLICKRFGFT